ncbi:YqjF family protein [Planosporangium sp. 12N6]|uniref:YqjF family protein n=1 Tax=Planosporangium spinosum TaxID=3402278 RepID=UPI003CE7F69C
MRAPEPEPVETATMIQHWRLMTFIHWRYPVTAVRRLLPAGLELDTYDGDAWVGLIPFRMQGVRPPAAPALPYLSSFPETNVRTYVRGPEGGRGIFFLTVEAARLPAVLTARLSLGLPYAWSAADVEVGERHVTYRGRRRWPGPTGAGYEARVRMGPAIPEEDLGPLDHFLTARYRLYTVFAGRLVAVDAEHPPWPLHEARLEHLRQDLLPAVGVPDPQGTPLLHASPGVAVRIGLPKRVG